MKSIIILGANGHGKVVADIAKKNGYTDIAFLDDKDSLTECSGYSVQGKCSCFTEYDCDMIVAIGNANVRQRFQELLESAGKTVLTLIHPNAVVDESVEIGCGSVVMAGAVINAGSKIGKGCIINTCASVDHDCILEDFVHVSVDAHLAGTVSVGRRTWIGIGTVVSNNLKITGDCMIGAGAVVVKDINVPGTYIGVPAMKKDCQKIRGGGG